MTERAKESPRLGLALGGGTARGLAHVGVLKVLDANGLAPDVIAGTSFGAIIAAVYALGATGVSIEHAIRQQNVMEIWFQALDFGLHKAAIINGRRLSYWLDRKYFHGATFADLERPLAIGCTDLATGELAIIREGSVAEAVRASCALPIYFAPAELNGQFLIDGGFVEPVPFRTLSALGPDIRLGVHAGINAERAALIQGTLRLHRSGFGRGFQRAANHAPLGLAIGRLMRGVAVTARSYEHRLEAPAGAHLLRIHPPIAWWDFHKSPVAIEAGEQAMRDALEQVLSPEQVLSRGQTSPS